MRSCLVALALCLSAPALPAQDLSPQETATLPRLIDSLCLDLHPSNGCEQVILLTGAESYAGADLVILTDRRRHEGGGQPLLVLRDAAYDGPMWGMNPSLEEGPDRSLLLRSEQSGMGRMPWFQTLRIGWQDEAFRVLGFSYSSYDRLTSGGFDCDLAYDSGHWSASVYWVDPESGEDRGAETREGDLDGPPPVLDARTAHDMPAPCRAVQDLYWERME